MGQIIDAVVPVFAIIGIGWVAGHRWGVTGEVAAVLNRFVFMFALPTRAGLNPGNSHIAGAARS